VLNPLQFYGELASLPLWVQWWTNWMSALNLAALIFIRTPQGRAVLAAWVAVLVLMPLLYAVNGFNGFLGVVHLVAWIPLLVYLVRGGYRTARGAWLRRYLILLAATISVSLILDIKEVAAYLLAR